MADSRFQVARVNFEDETSFTAQESQDGRSLRHYTHEVLPREDHYRDIMSIRGHVSRPTLDDLHYGGPTSQDNKTNGELQKAEEGETSVSNPAVKFGWVQGVLVRCLLNIWGVILFLRLPWVVGQAGLVMGSLVILLATVVTILTSLSMSAICTNGVVKGGGTYYMISRSLGPEFGGSIGLIFSLANAVAVAMYVVGFAETVVELLVANGLAILDGDINDIRIVSCVTVVALLGIAIVGMAWETKAQIFLLFILLAAMVTYVVGACLPTNPDKFGKGFVGFNAEVVRANLWSDFRGENFFSVFAVFFPAATGILAGANISGDLKDPQRAIPRGTLLAIALTTTSYLSFAFISGATVVRDAVGQPTLSFANMTDCSLPSNNTCSYGLMNSFQVMEMVSAFGPFITAGIFAATLSSALASLVSAPKVFQALCRDKLFPYIHPFGRGYGKNDEPRKGYLVAFVIALLFCGIGKLNHIAPIISNFFLAAYCLINFSTFHASYAKSPGFRPAFKYYNKWLSLAGALVCLTVMFIMVWWTALVTFVAVAVLYYYIHHRQPDVNWGSSNHALSYREALHAVMKLNLVPDHVKNYRPQVLVLCGPPPTRPALVDLAYAITKHSSLLICGHVIPAGLQSRHRAQMLEAGYSWLKQRKIKAFYNLMQDDNFSHGVQALVQLAGVGKLQPNVVLMGYKCDWQRCPPEELVEYLSVIHGVLDMQLSLAILRLPTTPLDTESLGRRSDSDGLTELSIGDSAISLTPATLPSKTPEEPPKDLPLHHSVFQRKQKKGTIDVWWLYDDGGLTMLLPYILNSRTQWSDCKLRIFALANKQSELDSEQRSMASLLNKFRIDFSDVIVVPDVVKPPHPSSVAQFEDLISPWREDQASNPKAPWVITDAELNAFTNKTNRQMRLKELLLQYSQEATFIVMTLPMPRKEMCSAPLFLAWLETLTRDMPPFLLVRGNQSSVLTFYS